MLARARAELSVTAYRHNLDVLARHAGVPLLLPVKANAYGHGIGTVVRAAREVPHVWGFAVATPQEVLDVLAARPEKPVVLLTPPAPDELGELVELGVRLAVTSREEALRLPRGARVHLKVNTGMNRLGVRPEQAPELAAWLHERGHLEGLYTHFAAADAPDLTSAHEQLVRFRQVVRDSPAALRHASNSGGVLTFGPHAAFDLVRPGIAAYGFAPEPHLADVLPLRPALTLRARVSLVHDIRAGERVSYGGLWTAARDTTVAVVGFGYADGYPRVATGQAHVVVAGETRPVLGRICMDQFMLDVTNLSVQPGDWVEVFGAGAVTADDVARWGNTISYEVLVRLGPRVERFLREDPSDLAFGRNSTLKSGG